MHATCNVRDACLKFHEEWKTECKMQVQWGMGLVIACSALRMSEERNEKWPESEHFYLCKIIVWKNFIFLFWVVV